MLCTDLKDNSAICRGQFTATLDLPYPPQLCDHVAAHGTLQFNDFMHSGILIHLLHYVSPTRPMIKLEKKKIHLLVSLRFGTVLLKFIQH